MGDIRKIRRKYDVPTHPWEADRIEEEKRLQRDYGLKNKREVWKAQKKLKKFRSQAGNLLTARSEEAEKQKRQLVEKLNRLGILKEEASLDDVLLLTINDILDRRLQSLVYKKGLANSLKQARQFIVHGHISVGGKEVTAPGYLVEKGEEISYVEGTNVDRIVGQNAEEAA